MSLLARAEAAIGGRASTSYAVDVLEVDRARWVAAATAARDELGLDLFDCLVAVDHADDGFELVARLWSVAGREGLVLRTTCPRDDAVVESLSGVYAGAAWHERHAAEMLGIGFPGHPGLTRLLLPDSVDGPPLRKDVPLASRGARPGPGTKEPGESDADLATPRPGRRVRAPGVPEWS